MSASLNPIALELVDRLAERDPLARVLRGVVDRALRDADRLRGGAEPRALERPERDRHAPALLADQVLRRHAHVLEQQLAGRRAADPHLVLELADAEPGPVGLDDERARAPRLAVGDREDHVEVGDRRVGDPVLGPVDHPLVAVAHRGSCRIEPASEPESGSDSANAGDHSPLAHRGRPLLALARRAEARDRQRAEVLDHQDQRARRAGLGDLLDRDVEHQRPGAGAAVLGLERQADEVVLGEQLADVPRVLAARVDLGRARCDALGDDLADRVAQVAQVLR